MLFFLRIEYILEICRRIANSSVFIQLIETLVDKRFKQFLICSGEFDKHQFGLQKGIGTKNAVIENLYSVM